MNDSLKVDWDQCQKGERGRKIANEKNILRPSFFLIDWVFCHAQKCESMLMNEEWNILARPYAFFSFSIWFRAQILRAEYFFYERPEDDNFKIENLSLQSR